MSCDFIETLPAWFMLAGWVLFIPGVLLLRQSAKNLWRARRLMRAANQRIEISEALSDIIAEELVPYSAINEIPRTAPALRAYHDSLKGVK